MSHRYSCSRPSGEKKLASAYASFSFHLLMKLSWHELHARLSPMKICEVFCAACIAGVMLAFTTPRQLTPMTNPSGSSGAVGFSSFSTIRLYGMLAVSADDSQGVMLFRDDVSE